MLQQILLFFASLVLFFFGMLKLSESMQHIVSVNARNYAKKITKNAFYGVGIGTILAALFQSSTAASVMTIGIVSAGIITFYQSLGIILGANVGTTITAQLVSFKFFSLAPFFMFFGFFSWFLMKGKGKQIGMAIFYFGMLFFGLLLMSNAFKPLSENTTLLNFLTKFSSPFFGVLAGFAFTAIVQSSALTTSMIVLLALQNLLNLNAAIPLVLGANMGTLFTAALAAAGASKSAKRTALSHVLFNIIGVLIFLPFIAQFTSLIALTSNNIARQVANAHTIFNVINCAIFFLLLPYFSRIIEKIIPGKEKVLHLFPEYLDKKLVSSPSLALKAASKELRREAILAKKMFQEARMILNNFSKARLQDIFYVEIIVDNLQKEISMYLDELSKEKFERKEAERLLHYSAMVDDIERIADHSTNLAKLAELKSERNVSFSKYAKKELEEIYEFVKANVDDAIFLIVRYEKKKTKNIFEREQEIDEKVREAKERHAERFYKRVCMPLAGPIFVEILDNLERVSDHCVNIAEYLEELEA